MRAAVVALLAAFALSGAAGALPVPNNPVIPNDLIFIEFLTYMVPVTYIASGGPVTWDNSEFLPGFDIEHTVTADDGSFDSGRMPFHATFTHFFDLPAGTVVEYHCETYDFMHGVVVVV